MRELTIKQKKFVKDLAKHGNQTRAYLNAYETTSRKTASVEGSRLLAKPSVGNAVLQELQRQELTDELIVGSIKKNMLMGEGVKATARDSLRAAELLLRLKDAFPPKKRQSASVSVNYDYSQMSKAELLELHKKFDGLLEQGEKIEKTANF